MKTCRKMCLVRGCVFQYRIRCQLLQVPALGLRYSGVNQGKTGIILLRFVSLSMADLQKILCKGGRNNLSSGTHASIAGIATWLTMHFAIAGVVSTGLATAILIALAKATKGGFCK